MANRPKLNARRLLTEWTVGKIGAALLVLALLIGIIGYGSQHPEGLNLRQLLADYYAIASTGLATAAIMVLILNGLVQRRELERERARLIHQMSGPDNGLARQAVRELRAHGWLEDGSLIGASLFRANLEEAVLGEANLQEAVLGWANLKGASLFEGNLRGANLSSANLEGADLSRADLQGANLLGAHLRKAVLGEANLKEAQLDEASLQEADLHWANLRDARLERTNLDGAELNGANLKGVILISEDTLSRSKSLRGAILGDGSRYDGRYNLPGDIEVAKFSNTDINDPVAMAAFYEVPLEVYQRGQDSRPGNRSSPRRSEGHPPTNREPQETRPDSGNNSQRRQDHQPEEKRDTPAVRSETPESAADDGAPS